MHIIRRQALSGRAIIRSQNAIFSEHGAIDMALDLLSERGCQWAAAAAAALSGADGPQLTPACFPRSPCACRHDDIGLFQGAAPGKSEHGDR